MNMHAVTHNMHVTGATFCIGDPTATVSEYELYPHNNKQHQWPLAQGEVDIT